MFTLAKQSEPTNVTLNGVIEDVQTRVTACGGSHILKSSHVGIDQFVWLAKQS